MHRSNEISALFNIIFASYFSRSGFFCHHVLLEHLVVLPCAISCANTPDMMPLAIKSMSTACTALSSVTASSAQAKRCWTPPTFLFFPDLQGSAFMLTCSDTLLPSKCFHDSQDGKCMEDFAIILINLQPSCDYFPKALHFLDGKFTHILLCMIHIYCLLQRWQRQLDEP